jgi:hypothetical protein
MSSGNAIPDRLVPSAETVVPIHQPR